MGRRGSFPWAVTRPRARSEDQKSRNNYNVQVLMKPFVIPRTRKVSNNEKRQSVHANPETTEVTIIEHRF